PPCLFVLTADTEVCNYAWEGTGLHQNDCSDELSNGVTPEGGRRGGAQQRCTGYRASRSAALLEAEHRAFVVSTGARRRSEEATCCVCAPLRTGDRASGGMRRGRFLHFGRNDGGTVGMTGAVGVE